MRDLGERVARRGGGGQGPAPAFLFSRYPGISCDLRGPRNRIAESVTTGKNVSPTVYARVQRLQGNTYRSLSIAEANECASTSGDGRVFRPGDTRVADGASFEMYGNAGVNPASCDGAEVGECRD